MHRRFPLEFPLQINDENNLSKEKRICFLPKQKFETPPNFGSRIIRLVLASFNGLTQIVVGVMVTDGA